MRSGEGRQADGVMESNSKKRAAAFAALLLATGVLHAQPAANDVDMFLARMAEFAHGTPSVAIKPIEKKYDLLAYQVSRGAYFKSTQLRPIDFSRTAIDKLNVNLSSL